MKYNPLKRKYPYLGISQAGTIVQFESPKSGTIVETPSPYKRVNEKSHFWIEQFFIPIPQYNI